MASAILRKAWQGKWAVVTGASAGIGEAIAVELAEAGVNLVLTARRRERLDLLAERLRTSIPFRPGDRCRPYPAQAPQQIFDATEGAGLQVDVLVNNAGFGEYGEFLRSSLEMQVDMVQVNCAAVVHLTRLFLPRDGRAAAGRGHDCGLDRRLPAGSLSGDLRSHQGLRSHAGRSAGRRNEALWGARECPVSRADRIGV